MKCCIELEGMKATLESNLEHADDAVALVAACLVAVSYHKDSVRDGMLAWLEEHYPDFMDDTGVEK